MATPQASDNQIVTVETNNFNQVLKEFDDDGHIINPNTRFRISCAICNQRDLAIVNDKLDKLSYEAHEPYTVLPRCKHAFGYACLLSWIVGNGRNTRRISCPICRALVFDGDQSVPNKYGAEGVEEQHGEIVNIRSGTSNAVNPGNITNGNAGNGTALTPYLPELRGILIRMSQLEEDIPVPRDLRELDDHARRFGLLRRALSDMTINPVERRQRIRDGFIAVMAAIEDIVSSTLMVWSFQPLTVAT
ncbi:hypothetical protein GGR52DRAFT_588661 [Hypoxylon sp. FL1284]|nr:hypothetical protein GGR52DRAFT_588661 [Hypoxylon sp. FL1284]